MRRPVVLILFGELDIAASPSSACHRQGRGGSSPCRRPAEQPGILPRKLVTPADKAIIPRTTSSSSRRKPEALYNSLKGWSSVLTLPDEHGFNAFAGTTAVEGQNN
ncbi:hypothetical protein ACW5EG_01650 [Luteimonas sp. A611]